VVVGLDQIARLRRFQRTERRWAIGLDAAAGIGHVLEQAQR
jgi:hypothetical protein